jgi:tetratricopeptide (TPR) repeat protein
MQLRLISLILALFCLSLAGCDSPKEKEARYLKRGNELFEQGQFEKARIEYKNAARIQPTDAEVAYRLGLVDEATGDLRSAYIDFTHAEEQDAHFHPALLKLGEYYLAGEQYDEVQKRLDVMLADTPDDADAHALHAALLLRQKDDAGTEKEARAALAKDPANVIAFSVLTGLYTAEDDSAKALATVQDGIAHNPESLPLLLLQTEIYEQSGDLAKIIDSYQAILKLAPLEPQYRVNLAIVYLKAGRIDDAEAALRAGIAAMPDDWDMKHDLVSFLADHRGIDAAEKEIRLYRKDNPQNVDLNEWLVDLYIGHDAIDRAVAFLNEIIAENHTDKQGLDARTALARIDYLKGDKDDAGKLAQAVLEKDQNNLDALFVKAHIEADQDYTQDAIIDLRTILQARPKAKEALRLLGEMFLQQRHLDLAIDTFRQLVDVDPLDFAARVRLAQLYQLNGDAPHAMDLLFFVTKTEPQYPVGWESTARVALAIKDWSTAETAIDRLDALNGQHLAASYLRGQMLAKTGKPQDAIAQYKIIIDQDPNAPLAEYALKSLVEAYQSLGKMDEATRYIESLKSENPNVRTILGESYLASGKTDQAAADFDLAITAKDANPEPYLDRARMFLNEHKLDEALDALKKGATIVPGDIRIEVMEADIFIQQRRYPEAIALYSDLLTHNPDMDGVANNLAETIADYQYADPAALEKAQHVAERFMTSSNPLLLDTLAWIYYRQGQIEEAKTIMDRALSFGGTLPPQVHYHYGAILLKTHKIPEAKAELQKATVKGADYPGVDEAKKWLME